MVVACLGAALDLAVRIAHGLARSRSAMMTHGSRRPSQGPWRREAFWALVDLAGQRCGRGSLAEACERPAARLGAGKARVAPSFKDKTRYTLYESLGRQISHIAINEGNINRQCSIFTELNIKDTTLNIKYWKDTLFLS